MEDFKQMKEVMYTAEKNRIDGLDALKTIAAALVIFLHCSYQSDAGSHLRFIELTGVPIFFCISGYFFSDIKNGAKEKVYVKKIIMLFFEGIVVYSIYNGARIFLRNDGLPDGIGIKECLQYLIKLIIFNVPGVAYNHLWYLLALLYVFAIVNIVWKYNRTIILNNKLLFAVITVLLTCNCILGTYSKLILGFELDTFFSRNWLFDGLPFYLIGILYRQCRKNENGGSKTSVWAVLLLLCAGIIENELIINYQISNYGDCLIITPFLVWMFFKLFSERSCGRKCRLAKIGRENSSDIYIYHPLVLAAVQKFENFFWGGVNTLYQKSIAMLLLVVCVFGGTYVFSLCKQKFLKFTKR